MLMVNQGADTTKESMRLSLTTFSVFALEQEKNVMGFSYITPSLQVQQEDLTHNYNCRRRIRDA